MRRLAALLVLLLLALVSYPHAQAQESSLGDQLPQSVPEPLNPVGLPADTILPSDPIGYLEGSSQVTPAGEFRWQLDVWTPPGRNGVEPNVGIAYESRGGNGLLGVGFHVTGLSEIHRCGQSLAVDGKVTGVDYSQNDRFCLDGRPLVVVAGTYGDSGSEYRAERDGFDKIVYHEGNFFEPSTFDVWAKDGRILSYEALKVGRAEASPSPPYTIQAVDYVDALWVVTSVSDRAGNRVEYTWKSLAIPEQVDLYTLEYMPEQIDYTLGENGLYAKRHVKFVYEDRPDPSFSFESGVRLLSTKRLKAIELYAPNPTTTELVGKYELDYLYSASTKRSLLHTISRCDQEGACLWSKEFVWQNSARPDFETVDLGMAEFPDIFFMGQSDTGFLVADLDGDGKDDLLYRLGIDYFIRRTGADGVPLGERTWIDPLLTALSGGPGFENIFVNQSRPMDLEGDGALEVWAAQFAPGFGYRVFGWDHAAGGLVSKELFLPTDVIGSVNNLSLEAIHFGDIDGDNLLDLFLQDYVDATHPFWDVVRNLGEGEFANAILTPVEAYCAKTARILDSDGDGRAEVWNASNASCTQSITMGIKDDDQAVVEDQTGLGYEAKRALFADLNGDGLRDIVRPGKPEGWVRWNTGAGYGPKEDLVEGPYPDANAVDAMDQGTHVVDINGDGREDVLAFRLEPWPKIIAYLSRGDGSFNPITLNTWPGQFHLVEGFSTSRPGDFNGDSLIDVALVAQSGHMQVLLQKPGQVDVVHEIRDYQVADHPREIIHYSNQWSDSPEPAACKYPQRCVRHGMPVVREHWVWQGEDVGAYRKTLYSYEDPRIDLRGRGFLGFGKMRVWDPARLRETTVTFDHETRIGSIYPNAGLPKTVTVVAPILEELPASLPATALARVSKVSNTYALDELYGGKTHFVHPDAWESDEWEQDVTIKPDGLDAPADPSAPILRHRRGSVVYDAYGNVTQAEGATEGGASRKVDSTYDIRPDDWLISLPLTTEVTVAQNGVDSPEPRVTHYVHDALGFLESVKVQPTSWDAKQKLTTTFTRNDDGLVEVVTRNAPGEPPRHLYVSYDDQEGIFVKQTWNDLGFVESFAYHPAYGVLGAAADIHGVETQWQYDGFGRLRHIKTDGEAGVDVWYDTNFKDGWVRGLIESSHSDAGDERFVVFDELGRSIEEDHRGFDGQWVRTAAGYDLLGRLVEQTQPRFVAIALSRTRYRFDTLDRLVEVEAPDLTLTTYEHSFFQTKTTDASQHESFVVRDVEGRVVQSIDLLNGQEVATTYVYGDFDQIEHVLDDAGNETTIGYDGRGRRISLADPDRGTTTFHWNGYDELTSEVNALQQITSYQRDVLGRVIQKNDKNDADSVTTTYVWDGPKLGELGHLKLATAPDGTTTELFYDILGRPTAATWTVAGKSYSVETSYDTVGRLERIDYPEVPGRARFAVEYGYNAYNYLEEVRPPGQGQAFWTVKERNADGALTQATLGNGAVQTRSYYPLSGRLHELITQGNGELDTINHTYYPNGNLHERIDSKTGRSETFHYDALDRLTIWELTTPTSQRETVYQYDTIGNLKKVFVDWQLTEDNTYGGNGKPHALTGSLQGSYDYDAMGRMYNGGGRSITYTAFDLPKTVVQAGKLTEFGYDAFGVRVRKSSVGGSSTTYIDDLYERREKAGTIEHVFYVPGEQGPVAEVHFDETTTVEGTRYLLGDSLSSVRVVTDEGANELERLYFEPFGQRIESDGTPKTHNFTPQVEIGFTGHHHDDDLDLINMRGRIYDPAIRRFLTPDRIVSMPLFGQAYNRYSYVVNNPLRFVDPTGFEATSTGAPACAEKSLCAVVGRFDPNAKAVQKSQGKGAGQSKGGTVKPTKSASDASGYTPSTGAAAPASQPPAATPKPAAEAPSESSGGSGGTLAPESWKDHEVTQFGAGLSEGLALGLTPYASIGERFATSAGLLSPGPKPTEFGKAIGEMAGGLALTFFGMGGEVLGFGLNITGVGAAAGVPMMALSTALVAGGVGNMAAGLQGLTQALTTGSGNSTALPSKGVPPEHLVPTHRLGMSEKRFTALKADIAKNGMKETVKYVEKDGKKYIVDGHHRVRAARELGLREVPAEQVQLPYKGYRTPNDLIDWER